MAHEQVDENGHSWRSGAKIEKKLLKQWFIRTTKFAKDLYDGLNDSQLEDWRDIIKLQKHWIGECTGVTFDFAIVGNDVNDKISVWTEKPHLILHAKFIAVTENSKLSKHGFEIVNNIKKSNLVAKNPLTGETIPIFITDDINYHLFTDTYLGIPTDLEDDKIFADKVNIDLSLEHVQSMTDDEIQLCTSRLCKKAQDLNVGGFWTSAKLQDWLISRQRYWGTPIPIIHCKNCGAQPVSVDHLPVVLPENSQDKSRWLETVCPECGGDAKREIDTMDTFVDSSWYFLRYLDSNNTEELFKKEIATKLMPVDLYIGGKEHGMFLLYNV